MLYVLEVAEMNKNTKARLECREYVCINVKMIYC